MRSKPQQFLDFIVKRQRIILLFACAGLGFLILFPQHNIQHQLTTGDLGKDYYCFKKTLDEQLPFRDFWWCYGPLMLQYYALFLKFLGINIHSVLIGKLFVQLLSGIFVYLTLANLIAPLMALLAACWFWLFTPEFFYANNHVGGILILTFLTYCLSSYILKRDRRYIFYGWIAIFFLILIKYNIGLANLAAFSLSIVLIDKVLRNKSFHANRYLCYGALAGIPLLAASIYGLILHGQPFSQIATCFQFVLSPDQFSDHSTILGSAIIFGKVILSRSTASLYSSLLSLIVIGSAIQVIGRYLLRKDRETSEDHIILMIFILIIFSLLNLHEFLLSTVYVRSYWINPFKTLMVFLLIYAGTKRLPLSIKIILYFTLALIVSLNIIKKDEKLASLKSPARYLAYERAKIYITNDPQWTKTLKSTIDYLSEHVRADETFYAVPHDALLYFLTGKDSPTFQLIIFKYINVTDDQELRIIKELEDHRTNWVVLSNRIYSSEIGLGEFGKTYGVKIAGYIRDHFQIVQTFGNWPNDPKTEADYGVAILKRGGFKK